MEGGAEVEQSRQELLDYMRRVEERLDATALLEARQQQQYQGQDDDDMANDPALAMAFEDQEDKQVFLSNVLEELKDSLYRVSCDLRGSRVLEKMINHLSMTSTATILESIQPFMQDAVYHRYSSHVLQALIDKAQRIDEAKQSGDEHPHALVPHIVNLANTVIEHVDSLVADTYASHVVRSLLFATAGMPSENDLLRSFTSASYRKAFNTDGGRHRGGSVARGRGRGRGRQFHTNKHGHAYLPNQSSSSSHSSSAQHMQHTATPSSVPEELAEVRQKLLNALRDSPQARTWITDSLAGPVLQSAMDVVTVTAGKPACSAFCRGLLGTYLTETAREEVNEKAALRLPLLLKDKAASHLLEKVIKDCTTDVVHDIYVKGVRNQAVDMAVHPVTNFVVQRLLQHMSGDDCALLNQELMPHIEDILAEQRSSVVVEMLRAAARHARGQRKLFKAMLTAFHIPQAELVQCLPLFLSLTTLDHYKELLSSGEYSADDIACNAVGSQVVQALLDFEPEEITVVLAGFLRLTADQLVKLSCKRFGSFAMQKFFSSASVGAKQKAKVARVLSKHDTAISAMACHSAGSHVIDSMWAAIDVNLKEAVAGRLLAAEAKLKESPQGRTVMRNCRLAHFKWKKQEWMQKQEANARKAKMFKDIIGHEEEEQEEQAATAAKDAAAEPKHEIDEMFDAKDEPKRKKKHKDKKQAKKQADDSGADDGDDDGDGDVGDGAEISAAASAKKRKKNKSKQFKDLAFISDALTAGKKKKKKGKKNKNKEHDAGDDENDAHAEVKQRKNKKKNDNEEGEGSGGDDDDAGDAGDGEPRSKKSKTGDADSEEKTASKKKTKKKKSKKGKKGE
ncbi:hypothetical protein PTSG_07428 [Salpingoeca rosetta]|uniref:Pumilio domain-containing protein NOP9 n=1 Tax=Salpingoeca rosetta (strain ATCC 50818 / BSB-021) TaxID=946362 RepID=F2UIP1_SALR5|nr:uncharacterized protein PTSG_07428 [Salpingoeca rosetta]EGD77090.1 hypothetical protein PTSG_07428 [Salpingoeca rosetta]|eukprot:XP_004990929.1 hypothetical protein PTSG_07428 [Salpingoeca rosetta]